ncbi:MAG TPA: hypothetical protein VJO32_12145 [Ktedonobacteraceae bacterium]|nr:hypothetical protein [Ktedonobacteraceae bacterium]
MAIEKSSADGVSAHTFELGQEVLDRDGKKLGKVRARFSKYILAERGGLFRKAYYVPKSAVTGNVKGIIRLALSEDDLRQQGLNRVPENLYQEVPEVSRPNVTGVPLFGSKPLSPAETGHYNYGPLWPGMNTDASHSYLREEVMPIPQRVVGEKGSDEVIRE